MFIKSTVFAVLAAVVAAAPEGATEGALCKFKSPFLVETAIPVDNSVAACAPNCYSLDEAKQHLKTAEVKFANAEKTWLSCVDARNTLPIIGSPGGDAAEFIQALAHWANVTSTFTPNPPTDPLTWMTEKLKEFLNEHITTTRPFYFHTGQSYLDKAFKRLQVNSWPKVAPTGADLTNWLNELSKWDVQGCGHIRYMINEPEGYMVPQWIAVNAVKAIWTLFWDPKFSAKIRIENYFAALRPQNCYLIVNNASAGGYEESESCFLQQPKIKGTINPVRLTQSSSFVYHLAYAKFYREEVMTPFFFNQAGDNIAQRAEEIEEKAWEQFMETVHHIAQGVPVTYVWLEKDE